MGNAVKNPETGLTAKQEALVNHLVVNGGTIKDAAAIAGYAEGESGRVSASKTLALPHVLFRRLQSGPIHDVTACLKLDVFALCIHRQPGHLMGG